METAKVLSPFAQDRTFLSWRGFTPPRGALPLLHCSYGLTRQSHWTLLSFGVWPRSRSLCRLLPGPAAHGTFPTLFGESFFRCLSPYPGGPAECSCLVLPQRLRPSPEIKWVGVPLSSANTIFRGFTFEAAAIPLCSGLRDCLPPRSFPPLQISLQGGRGFYVRAERASLPSHASDILSA